MDPASGHGFDSGWRRRVLLVILRCYDRVRPLKHCTLRCVAVCDWTGLKTKRENIDINPSEFKCNTKISVFFCRKCRNVFADKTMAHMGLHYKQLLGEHSVKKQRR